jgi:hypothetical protein
VNATRIQSGTQAKPIAETQKNACRQPNADASATAMGGHTAEPSELPMYRRPIPRARSLKGSTRCTVCVAQAKEGATASPAPARRTRRTKKLGTSACSPMTAEETASVAANPKRGPMRCIKRAVGNEPKRYADANADESQP